MQPVIATPEALSDAERDRYQRTMAIEGFGEDAQGRLKAATVCCIGAGGLGGPVLQYLVGSGVGRVIVVDDDVVEERNLQRQTLYGTATLGASKADSAVARLRDLNPLVELVPVAQRITPESVDAILGDCDVVVDAVDNLPTRLVVADACQRLDLPLVFGAVQAVNGQVTVLWERHGLALSDLFPNPPQSCPTASEVGVLGPMTGWVGSVMATEVVKLIAGIGEPLLGRVMYIDTLGARVVELPLSGRN
mgnify:FL=1|jgi:probable molybdenum cofactor biosynthesis protein moeb2(mpt-synthase sulfurylase) (molybdopterin synthase)